MRRKVCFSKDPRIPTTFQFNALLHLLKDVLSKCIQNIRERLPIHGQDAESSESETEYPPTPPASDYSESRPLSPETTHNQITPVVTIKLTNHSLPKDSAKRQKIRQRHPISEAPFFEKIFS